jgi:hypothetical protein
VLVMILVSSFSKPVSILLPWCLISFSIRWTLLSSCAHFSLASFKFPLVPFTVSISCSLERHDSGVLHLTEGTLKLPTLLFDSRLHDSHCNCLLSLNMDETRTWHESARQSTVRYCGEESFGIRGTSCVFTDLLDFRGNKVPLQIPRDTISLQSVLKLQHCKERSFETTIMPSHKQEQYT